MKPAAFEVLPVGLVLQQFIAQLAVALGLAAGIDYLDQALEHQFIQVALHGPPPGWRAILPLAVFSRFDVDEGLTAEVSLRAWIQLARESLPTPTPTPE